LPEVSLPYIIGPGRLVVLPPVTLRAFSTGRFEGTCVMSSRISPAGGNEHETA
jgi:hypothetical protein